MIRTRHRLLACMAAVVALGVAAEASASSLLVLDYNAAKSFGSVHIAGGAIDLTNGAMIVTTSSYGFVPSGNAGYGHEYGSAGVAEYGDAAIHDSILEGFNLGNGGYWNGSNGIVSSSAANDANGATGVGWLDNGVLGDFYPSFRGVTVPPNSSIIALTYYGDTDLNGVVDISDYGQLVGNYAGNPNGGYIGPVDWFDGDIDYSGAIDISDYGSMVGNYGAPALYAAAPIVPAGGPAASAAAVPEPATWALVSLMAVCGIGVRSIRRCRS